MKRLEWRQGRRRVVEGKQKTAEVKLFKDLMTKIELRREQVHSCGDET